MTPENFIHDLYSRAVDRQDVDCLSQFLSEDVRFRIGNHEPIIGKTAVLEANHKFFSSVADMRHQIDNIWSLGNTLICNGSVDYTRLDGSSHSAVFATLLKKNHNKIVDYLVYADLSGL